MSVDPGADATEAITEPPPEPDPVEDLRLQAPEDRATRADWEAAAAKVLRAAGRLDDADPDEAVWDALTHHDLDGVALSPLGVPRLTDDLATTGRPSRTGPWDIRCQVRGPADTANEEALADLRGGATSLWLTVDRELTPQQVAQALAGVELGRAPVSLQTVDGDPLAAARSLLDALAGHPPPPGTNLGIDPFTGLLAEHRPAQTDAVTVDGLVAQAAVLAHDHGTLALTVDGTALHDLGASDAQELGWVTAVGVAHLRALEAAGVGVDDAAALVEFRLAATDDQFATIAKLRAARRLWARVTEASGAAPAVQRQHVVTSRPMTSRYAPYVNLLRTTVAAFAAGVGGADAITVLPFDRPLGRPTPFGRRIARNISHLLVQEAHVSNVADPAGGAWAVERLTDDLAAVAWQELGRIERDGGALAAVPQVRERVAGMAQRRETEVATRARPLTGVTEFPDLAEILPERDGPPDDVRRWGSGFETLRDDPPAVPVFLATMGTTAAYTGRATFAANLLAAGGVRVEIAGVTEGVEDVVAAYRRAGEPPVVCLAGADAAYAAWGSELVVALRDAGARRVVLAGTPGDATVPADAVDDAVAQGQDALAFLGRTREVLG